MVVFAYAVSVLFFDVYDMAIDTIFLCFCEYCAAFFLLYCFPNWLRTRKKNALKKLWSLMLNYSLCARIRVFSFSFSARIIPSKVIIFKKIMPKTHEILNSNRKGHPNFPCPGPKIVQWVKKLCELFEATWFSN